MPRGEHRSSVLLSREENEQVFSLIGPKCQSLATAVVQLFTTEGPAHSEWKKRDTGVLCLIKDNAKRSYFFRIFCLYRKSLLWEHEVYTQIEYKSPRPFLHTFEAEEYMTAFNFANEDEARILRTILIEKIELRKIKREEKRQRAISQAARSNPVVRQNGSAPPTPTPLPDPEPAPAPILPPKAVLPVNNSNYNTLSKSSNKKLVKTRKITKADIGMPQDFKHISHVGWDAQRGFDVDKLPDEDLRSFLSKAGVSETQLQDQDTREFIYGFIETHGGLDAVKEDLDQTKPSKASVVRPPPPGAAAPPVPERSPAPVSAPSPAPAPHPPHPPCRAPPPPPARAVPPVPCAVPAVPAAPAARHAPPPRPAHSDAVDSAAVGAASPAAGRGASPSPSAAPRAPAGAAPAPCPRPRPRPRLHPRARARRAARPARHAHGEHTQWIQDVEESGSEQRCTTGGRRQQEQFAERYQEGNIAKENGGVPVGQQRRGAGVGVGVGVRGRGRGRVRAGRGAGARAGGAQPRHTLLRLRPQRHQRHGRRLGLTAHFSYDPPRFARGTLNIAYVTQG